jgi:hypothetical protein
MPLDDVAGGRPTVKPGRRWADQHPQRDRPRSAPGHWLESSAVRSAGPIGAPPMTETALFAADYTADLSLFAIDLSTSSASSIKIALYKSSP